MDFDLKKILKFSFIDSFKQKGSLKYFLFLSVFFILLNIVEGVVTFLIFSPVAKDPSISVSQLAFLAGYTALFLFALIILSALVSSFLGYFIYALALKAKGKKFQTFTPVRGIKLILVGIASVVASCFSIFKLKLLFVPIASIVSFVIAIILFIITYELPSSYVRGEYLLPMGIALLGLLFMFFGLLLLLAYFVIIFYNLIRFSMAQLIFVEKDLTLIGSLKESWGVTKGKALNVFLIFLIVGLIVALANFCISIPLNVYTGQFGSFENVKSVSQIVQSLVDPLLIVFMVPVILVQIGALFVEIFASVSVYDFLLKSPKIEAKPSIPKRRSLKKAKN